MFKALILGAAPLLAVACNPASKFAVVEVDEPYFDGLVSLHTRAIVESRARKELTVESATIQVSYKTRELATARLMLPITIRPTSTERVRIDLKLEKTTLAKLQSLEKHAHTNPDELRVSIVARVKYGKFRKVVKVRDVPFSEFIINFETIN
jgi:hypothetical protein